MLFLKIEHLFYAENSQSHFGERSAYSVKLEEKCRTKEHWLTSSLFEQEMML